MRSELERTYRVQKSRIKYVLVLSAVALLALFVDAGAELWLMKQSGSRMLVAALDEQSSETERLAAIVDAVDPSSRNTTLDRSRNAWDGGHLKLRSRLRRTSIWGVPVPPPSLDESEPETDRIAALVRQAEPRTIEEIYASIDAVYQKLVEEIVLGDLSQYRLEEVSKPLARDFRLYRAKLDLIERKLESQISRVESSAGFFRIFPLAVAIICLFGLLVEGVFVLLPILRVLKNVQSMEPEISIPDNFSKLVQASPASAEPLSNDDIRLKTRFLAHLETTIVNAANRIVDDSKSLAISKLAPEQSALVDSVRGAGEGLLSALSNLLDFAKIESGNLGTGAASADVRELVEDSLEWMSTEAHEKGLELVAKMPFGMPTTVQGDIERLRQILANLIANAVRFSDRGEIVVEVEEVDRKDNVTTLRFSIIDEGRGIESDTLDKLLANANAASQNQNELEGIGLPLCARIARTLGGELGARSEVGAGSAFWFTAQLELQSSEPGLEIEIEDIPEHARVLVVDDAEKVRRSLVESVRGMGFPVVSAESGEEAMEILQESRGGNSGRFTTIILDADLPGLSAGALVKAIKTTLSLSHLNILLLIKDDSQRPNVEGIKSPVNAILKKPARVSRLREIMTILKDSSEELESRLEERPEERDTKEGGASRGREALFHALLAEGNPVLQKVTQRMLEKLRCSVDIAADGPAVLTAVRTKSYNFVLMDCFLKELSGIQVTAAIRKNELQTGAQRLPIIGMLPPGSKVHPRKCLEIGMDACIQKPVKSRDLITLLKKLRGVRQGASFPTGGKAKSSRRARAPQDELALVALMQLGKNDDPTFLINTIDRFIRECTSLLDNLRAAWTDTDQERVSSTAAELKSKCSVLGAITMARIAQEIVEMAGQGAGPKLENSLEQLELEFNNVRQTLAKKLAELPKAVPRRAALA